MHENLEEKLNHLGISSWKKRAAQDEPHTTKKMYLIDNDCLFLYGEKEKKLPEKEIENFFKTLACSLGKPKLHKIINSDELNNISFIFLLDEELPKHLHFLNKSLINKMPSIEMVCASKDTKINFLDSIKEVIS